jgi:hypothetical protein
MVPPSLLEHYTSLVLQYSVLLVVVQLVIILVGGVC